MSEENNMLTGAAVIFASTLVANGLGILGRVLLANGYSAPVFGRIMLSYTVYGFLGTISLWGLDTTITHYIPKVDGRKEEYELITSGLLIGLPISVLFTACLVYFNDTVSAVLFNDPELTRYLFYFSFGIPLYVALYLLVSVFRGYENVVYKVLSKDVFYNSAQIVFITYFLYMGISGVYTGVVYTGAALVAALLASFLIFRNWAPPKVQYIRFGLEAVRSWGRTFLSYSTPLVIISLGTWGMDNFDTFLLQSLSGPTDVAYYSAIYPFTLALTLVVGAFGYLYLPTVSRLHSSKKDDRIRTLYSVSTYLSFSLSLPLFAIFVLFPAELIELFYPDDYTVAATGLQILAFGFMCRVVFGLNSASLNAVNRTRSNSMFTVVALAVNIVLNVILIPRFGIDGVALATSVSLVIWNILSSGWLLVTEKLHPFSEFYIKGGVFALVTTLLFVRGSKYLFGEFVPVSPIASIVFFSVLGIASVGYNFVILVNSLPDELIDSIDLLSRFSFLRYRGIDVQN